MERLPLKRTAIVILLLLAVFSVCFLPCKIPYTIETPVKIQAAREWAVITDHAGFVSAVMQNNATGATGTCFMTELVRGDAMEIDISPAVQPGVLISAGDTVVTISSIEIERERASLNRELASQRALLTAAEAGEKQSLVAGAANNLVHAREKLAEQERIVTRLGELQKSGYVAYQEYETAQSTADLYRINVDIAEAELQSVQTGVRPEDAAIVRETIRSIEAEIGILETKLASFTITAPISGIVMETLAPDTLVWVADNSEFVAVIPVRLDVERDVRENMAVSLILPGSGEKLNAVITRVGNTAARSMREQVVIATAVITDPNPHVYHGELVNCRIHSDPLTIREYLARFTGPLF